MVGSAFKDLIPEAKFVGSNSYDLRNSCDVRDLFINTNPECVIHLAAKVGGVKANSNNLGSFYYDNILINTNLLAGAHQFKTKKVISLLSTCIYPDKASYPLTEDQIHNGPPHFSNYAYAHAKRMLDIQSQAYRDQYGCNFITVVPNNLYGKNDNFHLEDSHLVAALIRKIYEAKKNNTDVILWGNGKPLREFTYAKDLAKIMLLLLETYDDREPINVGNTEEHSVKDVAMIIGEIFNFKGKIIWDTSQPTGQHRKPSDNSKLLELGWKPSDYTSLENGLKETCRWFVENYPNVRGVE